MSQRLLLGGLVGIVALGFVLLWFDVATIGRALVGIGLLGLALQATWWLIGWGLARVDASMTPKNNPPHRERKR